MPLGYTIGGRHIHEFGCEMTGKEVPITPPFENQAETQGGRDGGWDFGIQYEPKIIPVDHYIWQNTRKMSQDQIRALAGHLNPRKGAQELIFDDEPDKMYYARLSEQINLAEIIKLYNDFTLSFICYDPFTYSVDEYTKTISGGATMGTIDHLGTHVSRPILVIDHLGGSATIKNITPDQQEQIVVFTADAEPGTYQIDMKEGTVTLGTSGGDKYIDSLEWIEMPQGTNTITKTAKINSVTVRYRHTWL